eukprot:53042-Eustigmatos_ZCMA.PRE.1
MCWPPLQCVLCEPIHGMRGVTTRDSSSGGRRDPGMHNHQPMHTDRQHNWRDEHVYQFSSDVCFARLL